MRRPCSPEANPGGLGTARIRGLPEAGVYHLLLHLGKPGRIRVGALGALALPAGYYTYTGRAVRGLAARLARHARRRGKRLRWHIDHLLLRAGLEEIRVAALAAPEEECRLARALLAQAEEKRGGEAVPARGFGASDCRCPAHLIYWGPAPPPARGAAWGRALRARRAPETPSKPAKVRRPSQKSLCRRAFSRTTGGR